MASLRSGQKKRTWRLVCAGASQGESPSLRCAESRAGAVAAPDRTDKASSSLGAGPLGTRSKANAPVRAVVLAERLALHDLPSFIATPQCTEKRWLPPATWPQSCCSPQQLRLLFCEGFKFNITGPPCRGTFHGSRLYSLLYVLNTALLVVVYSLPDAREPYFISRRS